MEAKLMDRIKEQLVRHEGLRLKPYRCTAGKLTIGIGRNLNDCGITQSEAYPNFTILKTYTPAI
ncbi:MAG: hypothetical protein RBR69_04500 [Candidatus Cloacimonadaceae bacterium]|jgi:lysozyme|nr:hypothetical protein [Candidatus Cloacimonadaceae bacterium]